jgi:hypothetical protein
MKKLRISGRTERKSSVPIFLSLRLLEVPGTTVSTKSKSPCAKEPRKDLHYDVSAIVTLAVARPGPTALLTSSVPIRDVNPASKKETECLSAVGAVSGPKDIWRKADSQVCSTRLCIDALRYARLAASSWEFDGHRRLQGPRLASYGTRHIADLHLHNRMTANGQASHERGGRCSIVANERRSLRWIVT